ncbi:MAG: phytanoyl-CoA dioxygenase [Phycisphaera sp.]|nr:phytanoyl-CoA dioxygenase [Phycisphaera sp.]
MQVPFGNRVYEYPGDKLAELRDCNNLLGNRDALLARLGEDGYLLVRGLHDRQTVLDAAKVVIDELAKEGRTAPGTDPNDRIIGEKKGGAFWGGRKGMTHHPRVRAVLEGKAIFDFLTTLLGEPILTFDYKWLRAVGHDESTGAHYDVVYMGRGSSRLMTVWTPFVDVPIEQGSLAVIPGSNRLPGFAKLRETYGKLDVDRDRAPGWFSSDPEEITSRFGGQWATTNFNAGDVVVFGMHTMHASVKNQTDKFRISTDTRFQPAADPVDDRWMGENPKGHYPHPDRPEKSATMEELRAKWGV